ncbi:uncharacterized protein LOC114521016 [Dendronephthya gigantea]|uniref:uncharacterized protein LOC114521016 n=1 Tax=Dendronephthya gigantea TaxID=151771 RepID=UPI00106A435E|nr:uncharacterized protein LOC114521016 [Dendronephthya gigantea]
MYFSSCLFLVLWVQNSWKASSNPLVKSPFFIKSKDDKTQPSLLKPWREATKNIPRMYMSAQRFPRGRDFNLAHRKGKLGTNKLKQEKTISSRNIIGFPISQNKHNTRTKAALSPWSQTDLNGVQTRDLKEQIMRNAEEYWWKSGFIEGLNRKLGETVRKAPFSQAKSPKAIQVANYQHLDLNGDDKGRVRGGKMSSTVTRGPAVNQGNNSVSLNQTMYEGKPRGIQEAQIRRSESKTDSNIKETQMNVYAGSRVDMNRERAEKVERGRKQYTRVTQDNNIRHPGTFENKEVEQERTLHKQNMGQAKVTNSPIWAGGNGIGTLRGGVGQTGKIQESSIWHPVTSEVAISGGTNSEPLRSFKGSILEQTKTRNSQPGPVDITHGINTGQPMDSIPGKTRTMDGVTGTSEEQTGETVGQSGQSGTTKGQGGSLETFQNEAAQEENTEISNSSPDCFEPVDLAFLVDGSGSIDPIRQFPKVRTFLKELASGFQIGPAKTKVGMVQFSGRMSQKVEFGLDQNSDLEGVLKGIDSMEQLRGNTYVGEGFKVVSREIFSPEKGDRPEVRNVLMLFTDGAASDFEVAKEEAKN